jgi:hypothetical protein
MSGMLTFDPKKAATQFARNLFKRRERQQMAERPGSLALVCQGGK